MSNLPPIIDIAPCDIYFLLFFFFFFHQRYQMHCIHRCKFTLHRALAFPFFSYPFFFVFSYRITVQQCVGTVFSFFSLFLSRFPMKSVGTVSSNFLEWNAFFFFFFEKFVSSNMATRHVWNCKIIELLR